MSKGWTSDDILVLARDYQAACVLTAAAELDIFSILADKALAQEEVAGRLDADPRGTTLLLDALVALELLDKRERRYRLASGVGKALTRDGPQSVLAMVQHQASCLRRWVQLATVVKTGQPAERQPSIRGEAGDREAFIGAMDIVSAPVASRLIEEIGPPAFKHLLDVGGASGTWTIVFLRSRPDTTATLFDLPDVIPLAEKRISAARMEDRVELVAGDFLADPLPSGADLAWVSAITHQNSRKQNRRLFSAVFEALAEGGQILIRDILMEASRTAPASGALFAINMLVSTDAGGTYTYEDLREDIEACGFEDATVLRHDEWMNSVIRADKPRRL